MYEELVCALRKRAMDLPEKFSRNAVNIDLLMKAADAIEGLSGLVDRHGGETGIKNLQEYASKYWETVKDGLTGRNVGKWIPVEEETGVEAFGFKEKTVVDSRCSACGKEVDVSEGHFNYCPNCGAKMIGGDDDV